MGQEVLNSEQKLFLTEAAKEPFIRENFYLTGGTALSAFYLNHRYSEDLDFFTKKEISDFQPIAIFIKKIKPIIKIKTTEIRHSYNRHLFYFYLDNGNILKTEFTYFPFDELDKPLIWQNLKIDSLLDIAVNKVQTLGQRVRVRDFIDLFFIIRAKNFSFADLLEKARIKFDWHIDPLGLGANLIKAREMKDLPKMLISYSQQDLENFFLSEAKKLSSEIIED